ncbi:UNVERIFIED_CONTAM: hypothetical protein Sangu_2623200 [Sesamum angustifolium]|uniref:Uncharacterized protein n=1 Tax=Sesamum angustifolium TaxID=2727405 RepID=A0AAW2J3P4_9LAMI
MVSPMSFVARPMPSGSTPICLPTMSLPSPTSASPSASGDVPVAPLHRVARYIISEEDSNTLLMPVTASEVKMTFFDIAENKSGPNGFSSSFYKAAWPVVEEEVMSAILEFFNTGKLLKQVNATLLALIPMV